LPLPFALAAWIWASASVDVAVESSPPVEEPPPQADSAAAKSAQSARGTVGVFLQLR